MARKSDLTFEEIQAAEKASDERRQSRAQGFTKMYERDAVMSRLSNGVLMLWHVDPSLVKTSAGGVHPYIPDDKFMLVIDGKEHYFDTEDFRKSLRWA
jgi:hypothetical protein